MKLKIGILALDIALYKSYDFYSGQNSDYEDMEEGFAIDQCSKKCWKAVLLPTAVWILFTCIHEKAWFLFSNKSSTHLLVALNVIYHMM